MAKHDPLNFVNDFHLEATNEGDVPVVKVKLTINGEARNYIYRGETALEFVLGWMRFLSVSGNIDPDETDDEGMTTVAARAAQMSEVKI